MNFNDQSIRLGRHPSGTMTSSMADNSKTYDPLLMDKSAYSHINPNNISHLTKVPHRKSVFTNNNPTTKSFANETTE